MPKVTIAYEIEGDSIVVNLDGEKLKFVGTPKKAECKTILAAGNYTLDALIIGLPGTSYKVTIDGATPAADAIEGKVGNNGEALRSRDFAVVAAAQTTVAKRTKTAAIVAGAAVATAAATAATVTMVRRRKRRKDAAEEGGAGATENATKRPRRGGRK